LKKYPVGNTGNFIYCPANPGEFEITLSQDSSAVYTAEIEYDGYNWAIIVVDFNEKVGFEKDVNQELLCSYLDFLQEQFGVDNSQGYEKNIKLDSNPAAIGVSDKWVDQSENYYRISGWIDNNFMAVLMVYGENNYYPDNTSLKQFLNGFMFK